MFVASLAGWFLMFQMDVNDLERFQSDTKKILAEHDTVDTVIMMSGIQNKAISTEITTNLTAPCVLAQTLVPHFASLKTPTNIVLVSSGLAFIPLPFFPVYNATKGGIHNFALSLRGQLADTPINIIELAPPYVATELDVGHRDALNTATQGKGHPPMPLDEYTESAMQKLDERVDGKPLKEITVGFSEMGAGAWRKAFDPIIQGMGMSAM